MTFNNIIRIMKSALSFHPERGAGSGALGGEMLRGVYPERSEWAQHDRAVTHTDAWITVFSCIIGGERDTSAPTRKYTIDP